MTLTQLLVSYDDARTKLARAESYANPTPTSFHVAAELRKRGVDPRVGDVRDACGRAGLKLADV